MGNDVSEKSTILSVERAVILLRKMGEEDTPIGVRELARKTGYNPSTVQKLVNSLEVQGLVKQDDKTDGYDLAIGICRLGAALLSGLDVHQIARPHLREMTEKSDESSYLALLTPDKKWYVFVDKAESTHMLRWTADLGAWRPLNCTAEGKAILAYLSDDHLKYLKSEEVFRRSTPNSIVNLDELQDELRSVRNRGWAYSDEEFAEGVRAVAAPLFDYSNKVIGAVSLVGPKLRLTDERVKELVDMVKEKGKSISHELGFKEDESIYG